MDIAERIYEKDPNCVTRDIADETLIVPIRDHVGDAESIYTLNTVGARIWQLIDGTESVEKIVQTICEEFDVRSGQAETDALDFFKSMSDARLIHAR